MSYAQNREDVVVHRALRHIEAGRYVEVGANHPIDDSVTYALYERGWSGITVEPVPAFAARLREVRPRDEVVEAAVTDADVPTITLHQIAETGLSTLVDEIGDEHSAAGFAVEDVVVPARRLDDVLEQAGWDGIDIHLMLIDTEGAEQAVLQSVDLRRWRPWVLIVESTRPNSTTPTHESWEHLVLGADYRFCQFDGLSRFYVPAERWDELHERLAVPANILDNYRPWAQVQLEQRADRITAESAARIAELEAEHARDRARWQDRDQANLAAILEWRTAAVRAISRAPGATHRREMDELLHERHELLERNHLQVNHIGVVDRQLKDAVAEVTALRADVDALRRTLSWRVTAPLRLARRVGRKGGR